MKLYSLISSFFISSDGNFVSASLFDVEFFSILSNKIPTTTHVKRLKNAEKK